jgi:hypothetical protein
MIGKIARHRRDRRHRGRKNFFTAEDTERHGGKLPRVKQGLPLISLMNTDQESAHREIARHRRDRTSSPTSKKAKPFTAKDAKENCENRATSGKQTDHRDGGTEETEKTLPRIYTNKNDLHGLNQKKQVIQS